MHNEETPSVQEPRLWRDALWTARVIKNEDDDGWAVEMTRQGDPEPALTGPWTMGRDKKNPKPLDAPAFHTLVKTASEVLRRHEQQRHAQLNKQLDLWHQGAALRISLRIVPDDDHPSATLSAWDADGQLLAQVAVSPSFKFNADSAQAWVASDFARPR